MTRGLTVELKAIRLEGLSNPRHGLYLSLSTLSGWTGAARGLGQGRDPQPLCRGCSAQRSDSNTVRAASGRKSPARGTNRSRKSKRSPVLVG